MVSDDAGGEVRLNLPTGDDGSAIAGLDAAAYHRIVAPVLHAAAELAAARNDPDLANDMASMLALRTLVGRFGGFYLEQYADLDAAATEAVRHAPDSACVLPLERMQLDAAQMRDCIWALGAASRQLLDAGVIGPEAERAREAWNALAGDDREAGMRALKLAAAMLIAGIDRWERERAGIQPKDAGTTS